MRTLPGQSCPNSFWCVLASSCVLCLASSCVLCVHPNYEHSLLQVHASLVAAHDLNLQSFDGSFNHTEVADFRSSQFFSVSKTKRGCHFAEEEDVGEHCVSSCDCYLVLRILDLADALKRGLYSTSRGTPTNYHVWRR